MDESSAETRWTNYFLRLPFQPSITIWGHNFPKWISHGIFKKIIILNFSKMLLGHSGPVYGLSFSPDRTMMLSCSEDGTIRLWSLQTWTCLVIYKVLIINTQLLPTTCYLNPFKKILGPYAFSLASEILKSWLLLRKLWSRQNLASLDDRTLAVCEDICRTPVRRWLRGLSSKLKLRGIR